MVEDGFVSYLHLLVAGSQNQLLLAAVQRSLFPNPGVQLALQVRGIGVGVGEVLDVGVGVGENDGVGVGVTEGLQEIEVGLLVNLHLL